MLDEAALNFDDPIYTIFWFCFVSSQANSVFNLYYFLYL